MALHDCPVAHQLRAFALGHISDADSEPIAAHLDHCPQCADTVDRMSLVTDPILAHARQLIAEEQAEDPQCQQVIDRIKQLGHEPSFKSAAEMPTLDTGSLAGREVAVSEQPQQLRDYQLLEKLGEGGMGAVYKARHEHLDKIVAIKVLPAERLKDAAAVARFQREMRAVGKLEHPNIVRAMDAGTVEGTHFLVMEYVEGVDLSQLVRLRGPLPIAEACELIRQAAVGLDEAHDQGMVHRDIKPSNLMLCQAGKRKPPVVKVLDMGLALLSEAHTADVQGLTNTGQMMGTIDYMAPEQGGDSHVVDIRADIYSLGASLYKLLTGEAVYQGAQFQTPVQKLMALATQPAPAIQSRRADIPDDLARIVHRMLEKSPTQRYATPKEVAEALAPFSAGANLAGLFDTASPGTHSTIDASQSPTKPALSTSEVSTDAGRQAAQPVELSRAKFGGNRSRTLWTAAAAGLAAIVAGIVFYISTNKGTIRVEVTDPAIEVALGSNGLKITPTDGQGQIDVSPGDHTLRVKRGELEFESEKLVLKRGQTEQLKVEFLDGKLAATKADGTPLGSKAEAIRPSAVVDAATTPPAATAIVPAVKEYCLEFNGKDSYVEIASLPRSTVEPFTVECWLKIDNFHSQHSTPFYFDAPLPMYLRYSPTEASWGGVHESQRPGKAPEYKGAFIQNPISWSDWVHVAQTFEPVGDGFELRVYFNGKPVGAKKDFPKDMVALAGKATVYLGKERNKQASGYYLKGNLAEVRISKIARYKAAFEPKWRFEPDSHTVALYHIDEGRGDVLNDSSGNGYHGKIVNAKWSPRFPPARPDFALHFSGGQHVEIPTLKLAPGEDFTLEAWVRSTAPPDAGPGSIICYDDQAHLASSAQPAQWQFSLQGKERFDAAGPNANLPFPIHVAAVLKQQTMRLFVDGALVQTTEIDGGISASPTGRFVLGGWPGADDFFHGVIDEVRISKTARYVKDFTPAAGPNHDGGGFIIHVSRHNRRWTPDADTLALYHCDEGSGIRLVDASGNAHHGRIVGAKWVKADGREAISLPPSNLPPQVLCSQSPNRACWIPYGGRVRIEEQDWILPNGTLTYSAPIKDFEISCLMRVSGGDWHNGLRINFHDAWCGFHIGGSWGFLIPAKNPAISPPYKSRTIVRFDDFNAVTLRCVGKRVTLLVNGTVIHDVDVEMAPTGHLSMNITAHEELRLRDFRVTDLTNGGPSASTAAKTPAPNASPDHALHFTGKQMVEIPTLRLPAGGDFTLEAWVRSAIDSGDKPGTVLQFGQGVLRNNPPANQWEFSLDTPERFTAVAPNKNVPLPVHLAAVFKGQALRLFVDGTLVETTEASAKLPADDQGLAIGGVPGSDEFFRGVIDEVRVSKTARYDKDFQPLRRWEPDTDTLALYHCDEGSGIRLTDSSGNNHHGKITAALWVKADGREAVSLPPQKDPDPLLAFPKTWFGFGALEDGDWVMRDLKGSANLTWVIGTGQAGVVRDYEISFLVRAIGTGPGFLMQPRDAPIQFRPGYYGLLSAGVHQHPVRPEAARAYRPNDFNAVTLRCVGKRVTVHFNGVVAHDAEFDVTSTGKLDWLVHAPMQEFRLRDVQVTNLSPTAFSLSPEKPPFERALEFDGKQSYVNIPSLDIPAGSVTLETWVLRKPGVDEVLMSSRADGGEALYYYDGTLAHWTSSRERAINAAANAEKLGIGRFAHVAGVWDGVECRVYLNGHRVSYVNTNHPGSKIAPERRVTLLGADFELPIVDQLKTKRHFHGQMAAARFSKSARYKDDFEPPIRFESDADTLALYHFDEGQGDELKDSSGNHHHGKIIGAKWVKLDN